MVTTFNIYFKTIMVGPLAIKQNSKADVMMAHSICKSVFQFDSSHDLDILSSYLDF